MRYLLWLLLGLTSIAQAQKYYDKTTINPTPPYSLGTSGLVPTYLNSYTITGTVTANSTSFVCVTVCSSLVVGQSVSGSDGVNNIWPATGGELGAVITTIVGTTITTSIASNASATPGTYTLTIGNNRWSTTATALANTFGVKNLWVGQAALGNSTWAQLYLANDCDNPVKVTSCILMNSGGTYTNFWGSRTSDSATGSVEANISLLVNDNTGTQGNAWNHYIQTELMAGSGTGKQTFGIESSTFNFNSTGAKVDPFTPNVGAQLENVRVDCGQPTLGITMYPCTDALAILAIGGTYGFYTGINFGSTALDTSVVDHPPALALPSGAKGYGITWYKATGYSTPAWNIYSTSTSQNGNKLDLSDSAATFSVFNAIGTGIDTLGSGSLSLTGNHTGTHGTSGSIIDVDAMTVKDTASSGTVAQTYVNHIGIPTLSATSSTTLTSAHTFEIDGAPVAGTNVTITNPFAFRVIAGASRFDGSLTTTAAVTSTGGNIILNNAGSTTTTIGTGTSSGTVTVGNSSNTFTMSAGTVNGTGWAQLPAITATSVTTPGQVTSSVATGTAPLVVASSTNVANLNASLLNGTTFAAPAAIGSGTPAGGAFTTLSASSTVSGTGFSAYLASPPAIGGSAAAAGTFTALGAGQITSSVASGTAPLLANTYGAPYTLYRWGVPVLVPSGGSFANNGALTLTIALPNQAVCTSTVGCYMYFPVNVIASGISAGTYYTQCASTTVCTVFNNKLTSGVPVKITSPTAFSVTGPGSYAQTVGAQLPLITLAIPANTMGPNGSLTIDTKGQRVSSAAVVTEQMTFGGTAIGLIGAASLQWYGFHRTLFNLGVTNSQANVNPASAQGTDETAINLAATYIAIDSTSSQNLVINGLIATSATDWIVVLAGSVLANYAP